MREVKEETGIDLSKQEEYLVELATFGDESGKHSHSFALKVDEKLLYRFQEIATVQKGTHGRDEAFGYVLLPVTNLKNFNNIIKHNFAFSARAEFTLLVKTVSGKGKDKKVIIRSNNKRILLFPSAFDVSKCSKWALPYNKVGIL